MISELRTILKPRYLALATAALAVAALTVPWTPTYAPLRQAVTERYLETLGRATEQVRRREADDQRVAEETRRRRSAETEQALRLQELESLVAEFRRVGEGHLRPVREMLRNINESIRLIQLQANNPTFYKNNVITPEDASSRRSCNDPSTTSDYWDRNTRRDRNIYGCAVYLSMTQEPRPEPRILTAALLQRVGRDDAVRSYPFQTLVAYIWLGSFRERLHQVQKPNAIPELLDGETINPLLFGDALHPGFAKRLIETATLEEKTALGRVVYPDLKYLSDLAARIYPACQAAQRSDCLKGD